MFIADFHIHSKYSRATSRECVPEFLDLWARRKGLAVIGSGDFTHAAWRAELRDKLLPAEEGLYALKPEQRLPQEAPGGAPRLIISGEISSIYKQDGKVRKVHNLILLPSLEAADKLSRRLEEIGNLHSDGRPILGLSSHDLLEITLTACAEAIFIPAHIWTPHFSLFGAYSGFDDIRECFGDLTPHIHALETGLSSDPPMNWRLSALDGFTMISNSDAHSPANLAREANLFESELSYSGIARALREPAAGFCGTLEFFPEEGKYHYDGHRNCQVCQKPAVTRAAAGICPVCGGKITVGVLHRVEALADRPEGFVPEGAPRFESLVPLPEVIAASTGSSAISQKGRKMYDSLLLNIGPELAVLREASLADIELAAGPLVAEGVRRLRAGELEISPGYDGAYGKVRIMDKAERERFSGQIHLFGAAMGVADAPTAPPTDSVAAPSDTAYPSDAIATPPADVGAPADALNQEQRAAACSRSPAIAVIAGPGTGKTKTLVARIAWLLEQGGVEPAGIAAVTFTNKAAAELRERLRAQVGERAEGVTVGTFHSICLRLLQAQQNRPAIIDEINALSLLSEALAGLELKIPAREALTQISLRKNGADTVAEALPEIVYEAYQQQLTRYHALDYDDILLSALDAGAERFPHLLVDEFQDINPLQYRLIKRWSEGGEGLFIIGDPDQAIYGFRGAAADCFEWFFADHPHAARIQLSENYRSTPQILHASGTLMARREGGGGALTAHRDGGVKIRLLTAVDATDEALFVTQEIGRMVGGLDMLQSGGARAAAEARGFADIAVLYRTNRQAELFERFFIREGIPYTAAGRDEALSAHESLITMAFFRLLLNPADLLAERRCLEAFAAERLAELQQKYRPQLRRESPSELLSAWARDNGWEDLPALDKLIGMAELHDDLPTLLRDVALGREGDMRRNGPGRPAKQAVSLLTLHAAKGLEFPVVFLTGVTEGLIPFSGRGVCNLAEERRLFYVGMTRARDELVLLAPGAPSPFLSALPAESLVTGQAAARRQLPKFEQRSLF